jgi:hypothetical protein
MGEKLAIPKHLKAKEWASHKGIIAKLVKSTQKTGITEALKALEEHYNFKGSWGYWGDEEIGGNVRMACNPTTKSIGVKQLQLGLDSMPKFLSDLKVKLDAVSALAKKKAEEFKKIKLIPSSSRAYLEDMARATEIFYGDVAKSLADSKQKIQAFQAKLGTKV